MNNVIQKPTLSVQELALIKNDLSKLNDEQRLKLYIETCNSLGLNHLTQPFGYIQFRGGQLSLYAKKDATDQLRKIHGVSVEIASKETIGDNFVVMAKAKDAQGRTDEDMGSVSIKGLSGDALGNAMMKALTKAKRRVTLSICGLGLLDETEVETIPDAKDVTPNKQIVNHAPQTQEDAAKWKPKEPEEEITYKNFVIRSKGENNGKTFAECHQGELESYIDAMIFHFLNKELPDNVRLLFSMYRDYLASKGMVKDSLKNILK